MDDVLPTHCTHLSPADPDGFHLAAGGVNLRSRMFLTFDGAQPRLVGHTLGIPAERTAITLTATTLEVKPAQVAVQLRAGGEYIAPNASADVRLRVVRQLSAVRRLPVAVITLGFVGLNQDMRVAYLYMHPAAPLGGVAELIRSLAGDITFI